MLSKEVELAVRLALSDAHERGHEFATVEHLLFALLHDDDTVEVLRHCGANLDSLKSHFHDFFEDELEELEEEELETRPSVGFQRVIQRAAMHVMSAGKQEVKGYNVLVSIFGESDSFAAYLLKNEGVERLDVVSFVSHGVSKLGEGQRQSIVPVGDDDEEEDLEAGGNPLDAFTENLTQRAREGDLDKLVGREKEIQRTIHILCRRRKNNPLYVGEAGVGKTAMAEGLAQKIVAGDVPKPLLDTDLFSLDMGSLLAGTRYRGDFENRLKAVIKALKEHGKAVLVIDEIHTLIGAGATSGGAMDASNLLKPALGSGKLRCIGSTTYKEFRNHFEKDRALVRRFQKVDIVEPSEDECMEILQGLKTEYEDFHEVRFTEEAIVAAVKLSAKHLHDRKLPDKAIDLIDEAAAGVKLTPANDDEVKEVNETHIEETVSRMAQIPPKQVSVDDKTALKNLDADLMKVVFGQEPAVQRLTEAIRMARAGLRDSEKPIGSFLFTGPTGVGKTEVAKQLAKTLGIEFKRFDMSEYMERHSVARLIGAPPGYVGYDQGGLLTDAVTKTPHAVILLDEIEKAHPDVFNTLLQVMDYGRLTDNNGRVADFRNAVLIMTSNVGARDLAARKIGFGDATNVGADETAYKKHFSPEFRNRLDARIPFQPLQPEAMECIVEKFMKDIESQLGERDVQITLNPDAKSYLADKGYSPEMGARPLARLMEDELKKPLTNELLFGGLSDGGDVIVSVTKGEDGEESLHFQCTQDTSSET